MAGAKSEIVFWCCVAYMAGVALAVTPKTAGVVAVLTIICVIALFAFGRLTRTHKAMAIGIGIALLGGIWHYHITVIASTHRQASLPIGEKATMQGIISADPQTGDGFRRFTVTLKQPEKNTVTVFTHAETVGEYGDHVEVTGVFTARRTAHENPAVQNATLHATGDNSGFALLRVLFGVKRATLTTLNRFLSQEPAQLAGGILVGERASFHEELRTRMQRSGTTHIVALSGYNIAMVIMGLSALLHYAVSRRYRFLCLALAIAAFVVMTGASASVVRAALMAMLVLLARDAGRQIAMRNVIATSAAVMVVADPTVLMFDIGFQLSFMSLLGIVYGAPIMMHITRYGEFLRRIPLFLTQTWSETVAAQIAVAPLLLVYFQQLSLTGILSNIVILPVIPIAMGLAAGVAFMGLVWEPLAFVPALLAEPVLRYMLGVIHIAGSANFAMPPLSVSTLTVGWWYGLLFVIAFRYWWQRRT